MAEREVRIVNWLNDYLRSCLCAFLLLLVLSPLGFAAPRLKIEPPPKQISTGQTAFLTLTLEWPQAEGPYEIHSLEPKLENLTLENQNQSQTISSRRDDGDGGMEQFQETGPAVSQTLLYEFRPVKTGTAVVYPFEISYRKTEIEPWVPLLVPEQKIKVVSNLPWKIVLIALAITAGLLAALFAGFKLGRLLKSRAAVRNAPPPDPKQRIYAKAEESIATFTSQDPKEKLAHWSDHLKTVMTTYYDIPSRTATSAEVLSFLKAKGLPAGEWNEISRLWGELTEMQFSRQDIPAYDLDRMQKTLLQYVKGKIIIGNSNS